VTRGAEEEARSHVLDTTNPPALQPTGLQRPASHSKLGGKAPVDLKPDADLDENRCCPVHSEAPFIN
jgi:hypothetical protein